MSSRFVSAGTDQASTAKDGDWEKAREEVEKHRSAKTVEPGKQDGGKSLYEVLQANKAAKQEQFEEASKLRNQFRALDDSEIEFLDSIRESERVKENSAKQETEEQLELFRKQKTATEQAAAELVDTTKISEAGLARDIWTAPRKRRRDKAEAEGLSGKMMKISHDGQVKDLEKIFPTDHEPKSVLESEPKEVDDNAKIQRKDQKSKPVEHTGLGLVAYDSDDD